MLYKMLVVLGIVYSFLMLFMYVFCCVLLASSLGAIKYSNKRMLFSAFYGLYLRMEYLWLFSG